MKIFGHEISYVKLFFNKKLYSFEIENNIILVKDKLRMSMTIERDMLDMVI